MKQLLPLLAICAIALCSSAEATPPHPRLFADEARFASVKAYCTTNEVGRAFAARIVGRAETALTTVPVERQLEGRRLLSVSRLALARILDFGFAWRFTGDRRYLERGLAELEAICAFSDWHPQHYLDVGEMALAAAVGYDWFFAEIPEERRRAYSRKLAAEALETWLPETISAAKEPYSLWWEESGSNWNAVCNAGTMAVCWALWDDSAEAALAQRIFARSHRSIAYGLGCYAPKGAYLEGPMYWGYGTAFACLAVELVKEVTGDDGDLVSIPGFSRTCEYLDAMTGPTGMYYDFGDGHTRRGLEFPSFWLARRFGRPDTLARHERRLLLEESRRPEGALSTAEGSRLAALIPLWLEGDLPEPPAQTESSFWFSGANGQPCCTMGTAEGAWVALKGGKAHASHMHMDAGSFVYEVAGRRFVLDYGMEPYHNAEKRGIDLWNGGQDGGRWTCFRAGPEAHAIARVNGESLRVDGEARFTAFRTNALPYRVELDTSACYGKGVHASRVFELGSDGALSVMDSFSGLSEGDRVTSQLPLARGSFVVADRATAEDHRLTVVATGLDVRVSAQEPRVNPWAKPIDPSDRLDLTAIAGADGCATVKYHLVPPRRPSETCAIPTWRR